VTDTLIDTSVGVTVTLIDTVYMCTIEGTMKKPVFWILPIFIICLFLGSCATVTTSGQPAIFNDALPAEENAVLYFLGYGVNIVGYNEIPVNWGSLFGAVEIRIPGGNTQFTLNGSQGTVYSGYTVYRTIPFTYNFEKGKEYTLTINRHLIYIFNGKTMNNKEMLVQFNMSNGQVRIGD